MYDYHLRVLERFLKNLKGNDFCSFYKLFRFSLQSFLYVMSNSRYIDSYYFLDSISIVVFAFIRLNERFSMDRLVSFR
ncbi:hypothetical protein RBB68_11335 [Leptospira interrogans]|uniref:Uncharacterized protein n=16 Tax=Leptospira interrogans TaxID=173 RepID=A0A0E2D275_LEPIR|nr:MULTISPECIES: hypothetical protein [Leptospira]APH42082.1 Uncharacterized protein A9P81_2426 [Leptospira interrogans serovar Copenhageni/Icterohaemorrhagiae]EMF42499.1 hypothetical protein LEP1GSC067_2882 [Leptospira interrogans serovar Lora str. TE 1992]EMG13208.1 hypothetical protein LEP1GSC151_1573 [Leptospira interrogans serovar Grippotyphosa str. LT2186]EMG23860.1 hypothetical protein LEP1GSC150_2618 [Leptospira interrogans serovar Copenhageni str. LT2050]EMM81627.1 hypothetical protei